MNKLKQIFKSGSTTYFYSSLFFPEPLRSDVFRLYGFVRVADNFVDAIPQQGKEFKAFVAQYKKALKRPCGDEVIDSFVALSQEYKFDHAWTDAFLNAMKSDLTKSHYATLSETCEYMYGSAEIIGLYMSQLMGLALESHYSAQMLGRSMQYINFIRDIAEDNELGRQYLPTSELKKYGLNSLSSSECYSKEKEFTSFMRAQIATYLSWQKEAEKGFTYIPWRYRIPIKTASDMYKWTAHQIHANPLIVFNRKVKPSKWRVFCTIIRNTLHL